MNYSVLLKPLLRKRDISKFLNCGNKYATKVFNAAKSLDNDPFDLRPTEVPPTLVMEVLGLDKDFVKTQMKISLINYNV